MKRVLFPALLGIFSTIGSLAQSTPTSTRIQLVMDGPTYPNAQLTFPDLTTGYYSLIGPGGGPADGSIDDGITNSGYTTFHIPALFQSSVTTPSMYGQYGRQYGELHLGWGAGLLLLKSINDATPVIAASLEGTTSSTGDYYATKDPSGTFHTIVDNALGIHGTSFNGVALTASGSASTYLDATGHYSTPASGGSGPCLTANLAIQYVVAGQFSCDSYLKADGAGHLLAAGISVNTGVTGGGNIAGFFDGSMTTGTSAYIDVGQINSNYNRAQVVFEYNGNGSTTNRALFGLGGAPTANFLGIDGNGNVTANSVNTISKNSMDDTSNSGNLSVHEGIIAYGNINAFPISPATPDLNYGSHSLVLGASLYDLGPTTTYWTMANELGTGSTPDTTLHIQVPSGGTPGNKLVQIDAPVSAQSFKIQNGATGVFLQSDGVNDGNYGATFPTHSGTVPLTQGSSSISSGHLLSWDGLYIVDGGAPDYSFCPSGQPTMTLGTGAGTGATMSPIQGSNCDFQLQILTGTNPASQGNIAQVTFSAPFANYVGCQAQPAQNAKGNKGWLGNGGADGVWFSPTKNILYVNAGVTPLDQLSNFTLYIHCGGN